MELVKSKNMPIKKAEVLKKPKEYKSVQPKVGRIQFNHIIITTDYVGKDSNIILTASGEMNKSMLSEVQTIIAAGPTAGAYTNYKGEVLTMQPGDRVLVDTQLLQAKRAQGGQVRLINFQFSKVTGNLVTSENERGIDKDDIEDYIMISDREILMVLP